MYSQNSQTRVPRFLAPDGSGPMPRHHRLVRSAQNKDRRRQRSHVPGPKSIKPVRVWQKLVLTNQEEARSEVISLEGPGITLTQMSSDSLPKISSQSTKSPARLRTPDRTLGRLAIDLLPEEEQKDRQLQTEVGNQREMQRLNQVHMTPAMRDQRNTNAHHDQEPFQSSSNSSAGRQNLPSSNNNPMIINAQEQDRVTSIASLVQMLQRNGSFQVEGRSYLFDVGEQYIQSFVLSQQQDSRNSQERADLNPSRSGPSNTIHSPGAAPVSVPVPVLVSNPVPISQALNPNPDCSPTLDANQMMNPRGQDECASQGPKTNSQIMQQTNSVSSNTFNRDNLNTQSNNIVVAIQDSEPATLQSTSQQQPQPIINTSLRRPERMSLLSPPDLDELLLENQDTEWRAGFKNGQAYEETKSSEQVPLKSCPPLINVQKFDASVNTPGLKEKVQKQECNKNTETVSNVVGLESMRQDTSITQISVNPSVRSKRRKPMNISVAAPRPIDDPIYKDKKMLPDQPEALPRNNTSVIKPYENSFTFVAKETVIETQKTTNLAEILGGRKELDHRDSFSTTYYMNMDKQAVTNLKNDIEKNQKQEPFADRQMTVDIAMVNRNKGVSLIDIQQQHSGDSDFTFKKPELSAIQSQVSGSNQDKSCDQQHPQLQNDSNSVNQKHDGQILAYSNTVSNFSKFLEPGFLDKFEEHETKIPQKTMGNAKRKTDISMSVSLSSTNTGNQAAVTHLHQQSSSGALPNKSKSFQEVIKKYGLSPLTFQELMSELNSQESSSLEISVPTLNRYQSDFKASQVQVKQIRQISQQFAQPDYLKSVQSANPNKVDLVFLHASPIVCIDFDQSKSKDGFSKGYQAPPILNFKAEADEIKKAIKKSGLQIVYQSKVATKINFEQTIRKNPKVIHISCHGIRLEIAKPQQMAISTEDVHLEGHYLLFENFQGAGELVSAIQLKQLLGSSQHDIDLIVVAACDSETIGRIFQRCSVRHVVCVEQKRFVLDEAAIQFTQTFYEHVFKGNKICEAFEQAKEAVKFNLGETEANLFQCLLPEEPEGKVVDQRWRTQDHECSTLPLVESGQWKCVSDHNLVKQIPARLEKLRFREKEISTLLEYLLVCNERIVTVLGLRGIGKSSLARNTLHYVADRKIFSRGILLIQLKDIRESLGMLRLIMRAILKFIDIDKEDKKTFHDQKCSSASLMIEYFISFFNNKQEEKLKKPKNSGESDLFLLCLDNAERIIDEDKDKLLDFLADVYDGCPGLRIIVTSNVDMGQLPNQINPKPYLLRPLATSKSAELFYKNCGPLDNDEVIEFVFEDKNYPIKKFLPDSGHRLSEVTEILVEEQKEQLRKLILSEDIKISVLAAHDMFLQISGNPTSITMMAAIKANEMIRRDHSNALIDIYNRIKSEKDIVVEQLGDDENFKSKTIQRKYRNDMSLKITTETSIELLKRSFPQALDLLCFMGQIPDGLKEIQLCQIWDNNVSESLENLKGLNFLEQNVEKFVLTPFVLFYCNQTFEVDSKINCQKQICSYYKSLLMKVFMKIRRKEKTHFFEATLDSPGTKSEQENSFMQRSFDTGDQASNNDQSPNSQQHKMLDVAQYYAQKQDEDNETKIMFEQVASELRNIENCINFQIEYGDQNKAKNFSRISFNASSTMAFNRQQTSLMGLKSQQSELIGSKLNLGDIEEEVVHEGNSSRNISHISEQIEKSERLSSLSQELSSSSSSGSFKSQRDQKSAKSSKTTPVLDDFQQQSLMVDDKASKNSGMNSKIRAQTLISSKQLHTNRRASLSLASRGKCRKGSIIHSIKIENLHSIDEKSGSERTESGISDSSLGSLKKIDISDQNHSLTKQTKDKIHLNASKKSKQTSKKSSLQSVQSAAKNQAVPKTQQASVIQQMLQQNISDDKDSSSAKTDNNQIYNHSSNRGRTGSSETSGFQGRIKLIGGGRRLSTSSSSSAFSYDDDFSHEFSSSGSSESDSGGSARVPAKTNVSQLQKNLITQRPSDVAIAVEELDSQSSSELESDAKSRQKLMDYNQKNLKKEISSQFAFRSQKTCFAGNLSELDNPIDQMLKKPTTDGQKSENRRRSSVSSFKRIKLIDVLRKQETQKSDELETKLWKMRRRSCISINKAHDRKKEGHKLMRSQTINKQATQDTLWHKISIEGEFILLAVANSFLTNDYEYSLRISSADFSYIVNSALFEGNILRYKALASIKLFELAIQTENLVENFGFLIQAIDSTENALTIYKAEMELTKYEQNHHGMALSNFTLGYIYQNYSQALNDKGVQKDAQYESYLLGDESHYMTKANGLYEDAYQSFKKLHHLVGMYLSKERMCQTLVIDEEDQDKLHDKEKELQRAAQLRQDLQAYHTNFGIENSCFIERDHGEEISLMTELVLEQTFTSLFPEQQNVSKTHGSAKVKFGDNKLGTSFGIQLQIAKQNEDPSGDRETADQDGSAHDSDGSLNDLSAYLSTKRVSKTIPLSRHRTSLM